MHLKHWLLTSIVLLPFSFGWDACTNEDGVFCPENPDGVNIGGRDGVCLVCDTVDVLNSNESHVVAWRLALELNGENATAPDECSVYGGKCVCRPRGETCYSDYGIFYDIWILLMILGMGHVVFVSGKILVEMGEKRKQKKEKHLITALLTGGKVSSMDKIMLLTFIACSMRVIWYILIIPGRHQSVVFGGPALENIFLKLPQFLWMGGFFYMASSWMLLAQQASSMKKSNPKAQAALDFKVNLFNGFTIFFIVPVYVVGSITGSVMINLFVNLFTLVTILFLFFSAPGFGFKLVKELGKDTKLGKIILQCCYQAMGAAMCCLLFLVANIMGMTQKSTMATFIFWLGVHCPEILIGHTLILTKIKQRQKVIKHSKGSVVSTTTTTTADETSDGSSAKIAPDG
mmetsp:Transcript_15445/g.31818  ORF Transcript_15445/g.31818 Transcript_15445/m.31818 type:complete len:402 (+) Transcript_15445:134-1339(+)|eukprot:CAMPEP_0118653364 /NCGR_PEP_ID=MMETSP0785-20121206/11793_1 /TAXON_ID=91992 /ORGANISM="Bolidomonas pacifica, Strain CCMP 1866" /LENGTH=401 /DNA_ID=CAMNT_0006545905 /DNA_START=96 /DNA_END=1301 /DNA_ORIENTATION=-